jgi:TonB-linked SusC/RagA family outer membrane protein
MKADAWSVTGQVTDVSGMPLEGVTVRIKHSSNGTITNKKGNFSIEVSRLNDTLLFTYLGYNSLEMAVGNKREFLVTLHPDKTNRLEDVVVIGYGTQKKKDLTGAVASLDQKDISKVAVTNAAQALQGRISGVLVTQDSWEPGASATVRIRGDRSITASNDPLYVIDGNPISRGFISLNDINPSDIASIEVLKDASATAIYGSRGANGVILITTKRGENGKTTVTYDGYEGIQQPLRTVHVMNGGQYAEYVRESYRNDHQIYNSPVPSEEEDKKLIQFSQDPYVLQSVLMGYDDKGNYDPSKVRSYDWLGAVMQTGRIENHSVSVRGGTEKTKLMLSVGYFANKGLIKNTGYKRYNLRVNLDHHISKWLKVSTSTMVSRADQNLGSNLYSIARPVDPLASPYDTAGNLVLNPGNDPLLLNPLLDIPGIVNVSRKNRILTNTNLEATIAEGLKYRLNFGYDHRTARDGHFESSQSTARGGGDPEASYGGNSSTDLIVENLLYYDKSLHNHQLGITLLQSVETNRFESYSTSVRGLPYESQQFYNLGSASEILGTASRLEKWQMLSWMGRFNYSYKGKYLLTLTGRMDGSSVLARGNKYQFFPSAAFAWRISDEDFLKNSTSVTNLKLRLSYGKTGNAAISPYQTQGSLSLVRYTWDEDVTIGYAPGNIPNPDLSWETTASFNLGLDFGLVHNRISGTINLYRQNTSDLIMPRKLPIVSGFAEVLTNVGETRNTGVELNLSTVNLSSAQGLNWKTSLIFSRDEEEITELINGKEDMIGSGWFIGEPINVFYDQKVIGIWQNTPEDLKEIEAFNANGDQLEPGLVKVKDINGDHKITTADDRVILGSSHPKWTAGIANDLSFRQFDLSFQFYASYGAMGIFDKGLQLNGRQNMPDIQYWTKQHPSNRYPKPNAGWIAPRYTFESSYEDISYLRLKYVTLGYSLPAATIQRFKMSGLRIYLSAQNPYLITHFDGLDPEGAQGYEAPSTKTFMVGINASF